ncbi:hypothetical protein BGX38DRAFT_1148511 [Terfezia claveryi]|nr:hypothetical protein BGX38DRAFT_1148511 [Terfezia claveryi]
MNSLASGGYNLHREPYEVLNLYFSPSAPTSSLMINKRPHVCLLLTSHVCLYHKHHAYVVIEYV